MKGIIRVAPLLFSMEHITYVAGTAYFVCVSFPESRAAL